MKIFYILTGIILGASLVFAVKAKAWEPPITYRDLSFKLSNGSSVVLERVQDPDNGNVCYLGLGAGITALSCLQMK